MSAVNSNRLIEAVVAQAEAWQVRARELLTTEEKALHEQLNRLLGRPMDRVILTKLIDQSFRSRESGRVADQINSLFDTYGVPTFFAPTDKLLLQVFRGFGRHLPELSVPKIIEKIRRDSRRVILSGAPDRLHQHLEKRRRQGIGINLNHIGEAVLGESEARARLEGYLEDLKNPDVACISIKISTLYSQINPLAFDHTVAVLKNRLSRLFAAASRSEFVRIDGQTVKKIVTLDMEEYRDLDITAAAFTGALDQTDLQACTAGIALQAYLPEAFQMQRQLTKWARNRVARGGSPIKIRIVKGANLEMERIDAAIHGWPLATYDNKLDVDANYQRMVVFGMKPENIRAVQLGIASHNLFDQAYARHLATIHGVEGAVTIEMLEGMANHVVRALQESGAKLLLYAPVATREQFINAVAYLIRRLDENTSPENFLRYAAALDTGTKEWRFLKNRFLAALHHQERPRRETHRTQNRLTETFSEFEGALETGEFKNTPDTDWNRSANRQWAESIRRQWKKGAADTPATIPLVVGGREIFEQRMSAELLDISQLPATVRVARFATAEPQDVATAVQTAAEDPDGWRRLDPNERRQRLSGVAREIARARGDLIGAAAANTGKLFSETDPEVSEAIDFAAFYPFASRTFHDLENLDCRGRGVGVVISPWNFPVAIPCGGILAALAAGNTVIFKPASAAVLVGWVLCRAIWNAGIPQTVLQFLPGDGHRIAAGLARHKDVDFVILTGGTATGMSILQGRPDLALTAETGGKNTTIVTAMADRDQAIRNVIHSAFSNSGQKCSATSLLILEDEVYNDRNFRRQLVDAAASLATGSAWDFASRLGPLIQPPAGPLKRALTSLEPGESWALKPENPSENPCLWTPGIKWGVAPDSDTHLTEFFGPLLGVMRARNLDHAIKIANGTGYGLTAAIETLDRREQLRWQEAIQAGNLYINRGTTGAMVLRQPFGGLKKSALGAGIKVGCHNYVTQFMHIEDSRLPPAGPVQDDHYLLQLVHDWDALTGREAFERFQADVVKIVRAVKSYLYRYEQEFSKGRDYFHLRGQDNILRYLPVGKLVIRLHHRDSLFDVLARTAAALITGCRPCLSIPPELSNPVTVFLDSSAGRQFTGPATRVCETDDDLIGTLPRIDRIRYAAPDRVPAKVLAAAAAAGFYIARSPVLMEGRIELLQYLREQSICDTYHRYGNLGERALAPGGAAFVQQS